MIRHDEEEQAKREFWILVVKLLFKWINDDKLRFDKEKVPKTLEALAAVRFDFLSTA